MRVITKRIDDNSFFIVAQQRKKWFIFKYWSEVSRLCIEIDDFWDMGSHQEGQPFFKKPLILETISYTHGSYTTEGWKPNQLNIAERIDSYKKQVLNSLRIKNECRIEVGSLLVK